MTQRAAIERRIRKTPSLRPMFTDEDWIADMWGDALEQAANETHIDFADLPESCPWPMSSVLEDGFLPE
ncbi:DUF29 family protein [Caballeronia temeraria]|nr:DUF29 family protein [Caballeronia temeraria]